MGDDTTLPRLVAARAATSPHQVALDSIEDGALTWAELHDYGLAWAGALRAIGAGTGDCVLSMIPTGHDAYAAWLGAAAAGLCDVHVNHALRGRSLVDILHTTRARIAVIAAEFWDQWRPVLDAGLEKIVVIGALPVADPRVISLDDLLRGSRPLAAPVAQRASDIACVIFTSGTTGNAKGVLLPWSAWNFAHREAGSVPRQIRQGRVPYVPYTLAHYSGRFPLYSGAAEGTRVCTRRQFKTDHWLDDIREHDCTWAALLGGMGSFLLASAERSDDADNPLEFVVAAPVFPGIDRFKQRFGGPDIYTCYGQSEITVIFTSAGAYEVSEETRRYCGVPAAAIEVRLIDEAGAEVAPGQSGEMIVRAPQGCLSVGYLNNPEATAATYRDGWVHTGDLFQRTADDWYAFVDRKKDYLRRRGENISSFEVEREILAHPAVIDCAVFGVKSAVTEDEVMASIVVDPKVWQSPEDLLEFLADRMPAFALPRYVDVVDDLPKTSTSKVQKGQLRDRGVTPSTWDRLAGARRERAR
jgi:crotonobetaine/carnitine-CoA ligase